MADDPGGEFSGIVFAPLDAGLRLDKAVRRDGLIGSDLLVGHHRTRAGKHHRRALFRHKGVITLLAAGKQRRQIRAQPRTAGDQAQIAAGLGQHRQLRVIDTVGDRIAVAVCAQTGEAVPDVRRALHHVRIGDQPRLAARLRVHQARQTGVAHRRNRVILHPRFIEQHLADEQIAIKNRPPVDRQRGGNHREILAQRIKQRIRHRADIADGGAVKRRTILEEKLLAACCLQPLQCRERLRYRLLRGNRARFQADHYRIDAVRQGARRNAVHLHRAQTVFRQKTGDVARAGEIVGNHP